MLSNSTTTNDRAINSTFLFLGKKMAKKSRKERVFKSVYTSLFGDHRRKLNDFSNISSDLRAEKVSSPVMQFYSSNDNIGNYLPVLGIQEMLELPTDTWCIHDRNIDFDGCNTV